MDRPARYRVLVVDDHDDSAELLGLLLGERGFDVATAHTVAAALEVAAQVPIDAVVSDLGLPDGSGYDLLRALRALRPLPAIAVTGLARDEDIARSRRAGFAVHLAKPIKIDLLVEALERLLAAPG